MLNLFCLRVKEDVTQTGLKNFKAGGVWTYASMY